jgi:hypothetical protein
MNRLAFASNLTFSPEGVRWTNRKVHAPISWTERFRQSAAVQSLSAGKACLAAKEEPVDSQLIMGKDPDRQNQQHDTEGVSTNDAQLEVETLEIRVLRHVLGIPTVHQTGKTGQKDADGDRDQGLSNYLLPGFQPFFPPLATRGQPF